MSAELECFGVDALGQGWVVNKKLLSTFKKQTTAEGIVYNFNAKAGELKIPDVNATKSCAYLLKSTGPHPNGGTATARWPIVGDVDISGMSRRKLKALLENKDLHLLINEKLTQTLLSH